MSDLLAQRVKEQARALGFSLAGVIEATTGKRLDAYLRWLANEYHGHMGYMSRPDRLARRKDLNVILPGVRSLVCVAMDHASAGPPDRLLSDPSRGRIASYAWGADYHQVMLPKLEALGRWLAAETGGLVAHKVYVDTGAILERDHAETAGLGFTGKNTMLIAPRRGSWLFLGELLTTADLTPDELIQPLPSCGRCTRCLAACPTDAFPEPYVLDARRCISYLTIELKGWIPRALRPLMGNWVYGCDICQAVCPFNRFAPEEIVPNFQLTSWERAAPPLLDLLALDETAFAERYASSPIKRIKRERLVRNACVAAGNWGSVGALGRLEALLRDASALVRGHAAWALGQIGGEQAARMLLRALGWEDDDHVRRELSQALGQTTTG
jgi:epoxyqueuosine reductase